MQRSAGVRNSHIESCLLSSGLARLFVLRAGATSRDFFFVWCQEGVSPNRSTTFDKMPLAISGYDDHFDAIVRRTEAQHAAATETVAHPVTGCLLKGSRPSVGVSAIPPS